jgi:hypothetical protein
MPAVCIMKIHDDGVAKYLLLASQERDDSWCVAGYETVKRGVDTFERMYNSAHRRSYEGSMSACINFIFMQPSIVEITEEELPKLASKTPSVMNVHTVAGGFHGITTSKLAEKYWEKGVKPALISDDG